MVNDMVLPSGVLEPAALSPQEIWAVAVHRRYGFPQDVTVAHAGKSRAVMHMQTLLGASLPTARTRLCT